MSFSGELRFFREFMGVYGSFWALWEFMGFCGLYGIYGIYGVLWGSLGFSLVLLDFPGFSELSWALRGLHSLPLAFLGSMGFSWVPLFIFGFPGLLGFSWVPLGFPDYLGIYGVKPPFLVPATKRDSGLKVMPL